ncbi:MAG: SDR family NAD(P)-dependent oxidoreductase, partial [Geminicoccales bacterium]
MSDLFDLSGRTALVTGASQGLGRRFAQVLAEHGAGVGLAARQIDRCRDLQREIERQGARVASVALDVTAGVAAIEAALDRIEDALGPIDILINNAGVAVSKPVLEQSEADWDQVVGTNLKGAFFVAQTVARRMSARDPRPAWGGSIVNIASVLAQGVIGHLAPYAAAKGGLWQITRSMALELARHEVRVNALAPGYIETEINRDFLAGPAGERMRTRIPQRRFGATSDLDGALLLLASDASRYITGSIIVVDGGFLLA